MIKSLIENNVFTKKLTQSDIDSLSSFSDFVTYCRAMDIVLNSDNVLSGDFNLKIITKKDSLCLIYPGYILEKLCVSKNDKLFNDVKDIFLKILTGQKVSLNDYPELVTAINAKLLELKDKYTTDKLTDKNMLIIQKNLIKIFTSLTLEEQAELLSNKYFMDTFFQEDILSYISSDLLLKLISESKYEIFFQKIAKLTVKENYLQNKTVMSIIEKYNPLFFRYGETFAVIADGKVVKINSFSSLINIFKMYGGFDKILDNKKCMIQLYSVLNNGETYSEFVKQLRREYDI